MNIGIFIGSFNPPHNAHYEIGLNLIKNKYLDRVIYVPVNNKFNHKKLASFNDRVNMLKLMIKNNNMEIDTIGNNDLYTYEILEYYKNKYKNDNIYLIIGMDNYINIVNWTHYKELINNNILVIKRNNIQCNLYNNKHILVDFDNKINSTDIRNNIKNNLVEDISNEVYSYIKDNNLYID